MAQVEKPTIPDTWEVDIYEHEREWGSKIDHSFSFDNEVEGKDFAKKYNEKNASKTTPEYYWGKRYARNAKYKTSK